MKKEIKLLLAFFAAFPVWIGGPLIVIYSGMSSGMALLFMLLLLIPVFGAVVWAYVLENRRQSPVECLRSPFMTLLGLIIVIISVVKSCAVS
jgi:hypothetical protein